MLLLLPFDLTFLSWYFFLSADPFVHYHSTPEERQALIQFDMNMHLDATDRSTSPSDEDEVIGGDVENPTTSLKIRIRHDDPMSRTSQHATPHQTCHESNRGGGSSSSNSHHTRRSQRNSRIAHQENRSTGGGSHHTGRSSVWAKQS